MKKLKYFPLTLLLTLLCPVNMQAWNASKETLSYDIMYKWGLINKKTGSVTVRAEQPVNGRFNAHLTGASAPWVDHLYKLRDTLRGTIDAQKLIPYSYEKIAYEDGHFAHDNITFTHSAKGTSAKVTHRKKKKKEKDVTVTCKDLHADGTALDMLSAFFYMRNIDYAAMKKGQSVKLHVFSGSQAEVLTIHYQGIEPIDVQNKKLNSYHITFTFTSNSGKKTSDNMDAWLSLTDSHIPLLMEGKLPVGKVRAVYTGKLP